MTFNATKKFWVPVLLGLALTSAAIQEGRATTFVSEISVFIGPEGPPVFQLSSHLGTEALVDSLSVYVPNESGEWDYKHPVWSIFLRPGAFLPLSAVTYGSKVAGFDSIPPQALIDGRHYLVSMSGAGIGRSTEFQIIRCDGKAALRVLGPGLARARP